MKTVRLPIFENGVETQEFLELEIHQCVGVGYAYLTTNKAKIVPFNAEKPVQLYDVASLYPSLYPLIEDPVREEIEMEFVERIIDGLPTSEIREHLGAGVWRTIENFSGYRMNPNKMIIDKETQKTVEQKVHNKGRAVMLFDGREGRLKTMDVDFLFKKTFPEYNQ